jgi:cupin superfamily acireductone dioxygenase involved in methionine salvage
MEKIYLILSNKEEVELTSYVRTDSELRIIVESYDNALEKLKLLTKENLSEYFVKYGDEIVTQNESKEVDMVRFPIDYCPSSNTPSVSIYVKLRKSIGNTV